MFLLNMFTSSYICNLLYNLCIGILSGYIFYNSLLHQFVKQKLKLRIYRETSSQFPVNNLNQQLESKSEKEVVEKEIETSNDDFLNNITTWVKNSLSKLLDFLMQIPTIAIYTSITLVALYFMCVDKVYMIDEIEHHLPTKWVKKLGTHIHEIITSVGNYLKAEFILVLVSFLISLIGFYVLNIIGIEISYPLLIALGIAFVDALPILGSGTIMLPWAVISAADGNIELAVGLLVLWGIMSVVRQFLEPKLVSNKLGIHPIFTLIAMYTGFKFIGVWGMVLGPIILIILKNIFSTLIDKGVVKAILEK